MGMHNEADPKPGSHLAPLRARATFCAALVALAICVSSSVSAPPAEAHRLYADSVDCTVPLDCEIRWEDHTRFDSARRFAIGEWNRLGRVDILPDSAVTIADLKFIDFRDCDVRWEAFWSARVGADVIGFNPCTITRAGSRNPPDPRAVAVHEVGHALRLAHPSGSRVSSYWARRSVMYNCARCTPTSSYRAHDVDDYRRTW